MKGLSNTQRTLRALRQEGRLCAIVERWNAYAKRPGKDGPPGIRQDLFGFLDIIALDPARGIVGIQSCGQAFAEHKRKILDSEATGNVIEWLRCGGRLELWGWRKVKLERGGKALRWKARVREFTNSDFEERNTGLCVWCGQSELDHRLSDRIGRLCPIPGVSSQYYTGRSGDKH